jgi:hypothetical protein
MAKIVLPKRPESKATVASSMAKTLAEAELNRPAPADSLKATEFKVTLSDGTTLLAAGDLAADVYNYLMDCERYCATHQGTVAPYLGPRMDRIDAKGNKVIS